MARIVKRGNAYRIIAYDGYNSKGKQITRSMTWHPEPDMTQRQIEKELRRQAVLFENSTAVSGNLRFEEFAAQWMQEHVDGKLKENTVEKYKRLSVTVNQAIGHLRINKINHRHIQLFINNLSEDGINHRTGKGLSPKSVRDYLSYISSIFNYALTLEIVSANPCRNIALPKLEHKERTILCDSEAQLFFFHLQKESWQKQAFFTLAAFGGFRKGEILGLAWNDIDFENEIIHIRRQLLFTKAKGFYYDSPKSRQSLRITKLPNSIFYILNQLQAEQQQSRELAGDRWTESDRLFTNEFGGYLPNGHMYRWLLLFCERHNLPPVNIHSFRHLNATLLIGSGIDVKTVSALLGHSQTSTTLNIYSHAIEENKAKASAAVSNVIQLKPAKEG